MPVIRGDTPELIDALKRAGLMTDTSRVTHMQVDIYPERPVVVTVEHYADDRLVHIIDTLGQLPERRRVELSDDEVTGNE